MVVTCDLGHIVRFPKWVSINWPEGLSSGQTDSTIKSDARCL